MELSKSKERMKNIEVGVKKHGISEKIDILVFSRKKFDFFFLNISNANMI